MPRDPRIIKLEKIKKRVLKAHEKTINYTQNELYKEAWKMFDSFIDQFYSYKTKSYIRHDETQPGTGVGSNLYRANNIKLDDSNKLDPKVIIEINSMDMDGGYKIHTPSEVLEYVLSGYRFVNPGEMVWRGSYHGKYFNIEDVTMARAFDEFNGYYYSMQTNIYIHNFKRFL